MRCLAVCQDELVIRMLDEILLPGFEVEFIVENRPLARRLHEAGVKVTAGDPRRTDTWLKADIGPSTCVIIEDNGRRSPKKILEAVRDAGGTLDRKSTRLNSSHDQISYAVFCLKKKKGYLHRQPARQDNNHVPR